MIAIVLSPGEPEYLQIVQQIRWAVANSQLQTGDRLTPVRALALQLGVNASTVARAYRLLEIQGIVETHKRRGTIVRGLDSGRELRQTRLRQMMERTLVEALAQGFTLDELDAAFGLQLAAWSERRQHPAAVAPGPATSERLWRFAGSHDLALEALWTQARRSHPEHQWTARYVGSLDGLLQLLHGDVGLAGAHILDEESGEYNLPILRRLFVGQRLCVVTLAERDQGLIVARGNPKAIRSIADLALPGVRFVNRQAGSGTRTLLDYHLRRLAIEPAIIAGYDHDVPTHTAVASAVAAGRADAGLGLRAAAAVFGLDFVPVVREHYALVCLACDRVQPPISWLLDLVGSASFKAVVASLGGYDPSHSGEETYI
jgi:molybdate-binding protein/DNA-binding transcriptional regulator YhcF (GntR family)